MNHVDESCFSGLSKMFKWQEAECKVDAYGVCCKPKAIVVISYSNGKEICRDDRCQFSKDNFAKELHAIVKDVQQFFLKKFGLCGIDGSGELAPLYIGWDKENAAWSCSGVKDTCGWFFHKNYVSSDVVAHEYMHAVIASSKSPLEYQLESGALDEHFGDVFAAAYLRWRFKKMKWDVWDWQVADRDMSIPISLRSFKKLKKGEAPSEANDYGHVHDNGRIPNHAFYKAVVYSGGRIDKIAKVWFRTIGHLSKNETFKGFAKKTVQVANDYCFDRLTAMSIRWAWEDVGIFKKRPSFTSGNLDVWNFL